MSKPLRRELSILGLAAAGAAYAFGKKDLAGALALGSAALRLAPELAPYSLRGKVAFVTGGSRGFGLAIAEELVKQGAKVGLLARDSAELMRAAAQLARLPGADVRPFVCDVTDPAAVAEAFRQAVFHFGGLDILVNNAGSVVAAPLSTLSREDYQAQVNLHLHAVVTAVQLARPYFHRRGGGRVLNISSVGGKMPIPHMSTYAASKFALAGFSAAAATELAEENVRITTAYPGLMRTGSPIQGVFKGDQEKEFAWFLAGDVLPGLSVEADRAARAALAALREGRSEVVISLPAKAGVFFYQNFPETFTAAAGIAARLLPHGENSGHRTGAASRHWLARSAVGRWLLARNSAYAQRWNQRPKRDAAFNLGG